MEKKFTQWYNLYSLFRTTVFNHFEIFLNMKTLAKICQSMVKQLNIFIRNVNLVNKINILLTHKISWKFVKSFQVLSKYFSIELLISERSSTGEKRMVAMLAIPIVVYSKAEENKLEQTVVKVDENDRYDLTMRVLAGNLWVRSR